jgi:predicted transcriptional regulator
MTIVDHSRDDGLPLLTGREMDVMNVLWKLGSGTVSQVLEQLADPLAYTTVLTILRTLEKKGHVGHRTEGRAHRYHPLVEKDAAREGALRRITGKLFAGSPELLMTHLLKERGLSEDQLRRLRNLVDRRLEGEDQ